MYVRNRDGASVSLGSTIQQAPSLFLTFATMLGNSILQAPSLFLLYWKHDTASLVSFATMLGSLIQKRPYCSLRNSS